MPCYHKLTAYQSQDGAVFFREDKYTKPVRTLLLPCKQCWGCRLDSSRQWAIRGLNEAQMHGDQNAFLTLTYKPESLPLGAGLNHRHYQLFQKRLRYYLPTHPTRYYMCGEYGERTNRPHYHSILFGYDFPDKKYHATTDTGFRLYRSQALDDIWQLGGCTIGAVNFQTVAYVARYIMQKKTGQHASYYDIIDPETGEIVRREPEYNKMSLKPGIGATWLQRFQSDVYPHGKIVVNAREIRPPKYYDKLFKKLDTPAYDLMLFRRHLETITHAQDNTQARDDVKEIVAQAKTRSLQRII